jgi:hypothetical protein
VKGLGGATLLSLPLLGLCSCGRPGEVAVQKAAVGDVLVRTDAVRVVLARPFQPGVPNGLYRGAVRIEPADGTSGSALHQVNAVCSMKGLPGWPAYDNLYGQPLADLARSGEFSNADRWQVLYHYDGRREGSSGFKNQAWAERLKDNLCRRGDFTDAKATSGPKP